MSRWFGGVVAWLEGTYGCTGRCIPRGTGSESLLPLMVNVVLGWVWDLCRMEVVVFRWRELVFIDFLG